ncbi:MAG: apolipoprotein N-acyltransferase [Candidatus Cloacimonadales bacterium]|nr:apolipoprotein N-acyltransferase [Candidatus Cloacimonadales bacterium]
MKFVDFFRKTDFYKPALAAFLLGVSRLPIHLGFLVFFGFIPLFSFFDDLPKTKQILKAAIVFAVTYTLVSLHWISLVTLGGFFGLFFLFSLYFFIVFFFISKGWKTFPQIRFLIFLCFWMSFEFLQNFGEFRFPWFNVGYSLADYLSFIQPAEIGGIYLLSALIISVNFLIRKMKNDFKKNFIFLCCLILLWAGFGFFRLKTITLKATDTKISLVQSSIPQKMKWESTFKDTTINRYIKFTKLAAMQKPDLIIWPESALPVYTLKNRTYRDFVKDLAQEIDADIFLGMPHYKFVGDAHPNRYEFYNSATLFDKTGKVHPYYIKNFVVPFGERMPFLKYLPFLWSVHLGQANWEYGKEQTFYQVNNYTYSPLICFEIAFEELTTKMAKHGVDFIVNITNDAWFYHSAGTYQHAVMTKFRAVETRRMIYRCANTGYSLIVSPTGEVLQQTELFEQTTINQNLIIYDKKSFFTKFFPQYPFVFVLGAGIMLVWMMMKKLFAAKTRRRKEA